MCLKDFFNGFCVGVLNERCEVDGKECFWVRILERFNVDFVIFFEEYLLFFEFEDFVERDFRFRDLVFW